jgi:chromosome segregation ATPase
VHKTPTNSDEMNALRSLLKATEDNLQANTKAKDTQIHELETAIGELQYRFEEQTAEKRSLAKDLTEARTHLAIVQSQKEARDSTIEKLTEEKQELKTQLAEARAALDGSAIPEVAAIEKLRQEKEQAENAKRKAEKEAATANSLSEYARQQYSEATARAVDLAQQNEKYETRIKALEKTASGEIAKARHMFLDQQQKRADNESQRLRQENATLSALCKRKEEELRTRKVGIGTRAGSVPRSPRVGPTSRAGSPISDRRIGAIKNNTTL